MRIIYWLIFVLVLCVPGFASAQKHTNQNSRSKTTYREATRPHHVYDLPRVSQTNQSANKDLNGVEKQLNRTPNTKTRKATSPKLPAGFQTARPGAERTPVMDFQYHPPKHSTQRTQGARTKSRFKGMH